MNRVPIVLKRSPVFFFFFFAISGKASNVSNESMDVGVESSLCLTHVLLLSLYNLENSQQPAFKTSDCGQETSK